MISDYTSTSVKLSWTDNIPCITNYIINSTTSNNLITASGWPPYELASLSMSDTVHYINVAGSDTGGRIGPYSDTVCFILNGML